MTFLLCLLVGAAYGLVAAIIAAGRRIAQAIDDLAETMRGEDDESP